MKNPEASRKWRAANREVANARTRKWHHANRERELAKKKAFRKANPDYKKYFRGRSWARLGIINRDGSPFTHDDYDIMFAFQNGCCAICGIHQSEFRFSLALDHDHQTGRARGLLCQRCNVRIIAFEDDDYATRCRRYIEKWDTP